MWTYLIQLMKARRLLKAGRYTRAIALLDDPVVRDDRRARDLRRQVLDAWLERARKRERGGHLSLALDDLRAIAAVDADVPGRCELEDEVRATREERDRRREEGACAVESFESALAQGRLGEARDLLARIEAERGEGPSSALRRRLDERRSEASRVLRQVRGALDRGSEAEAAAAMARARRLCSDSVTFRERLVALSADWARGRWTEVEAALREGRSLDAARSFADWWEGDPESENLAEAKELLVCVAERLAAEARGRAQRGEFTAALELVSQAPRPVSAVAVLDRFRRQLRELDTTLQASEEDPRRRLRSLQRIRDATQWAALDAPIAELRDAAARLEAGLAEAREHLAAGRTPEGHAVLERILTRWSGCEEARSLSEGLRENERERAERLRAGRQELRDGKLGAAYRNLLGLVSGGFAAEEARELLRDVEHLRKKVQRELAALEARLKAGGDVEELLREVARLRRTQQDSAEIADFEARLTRIKARAGRVRGVRAALERRDPRACIEALTDWISEGGDTGLGAEDCAALERLGGEVEATLRKELEQGDPAFVGDLAAGLATWERLLALELGPFATEARERIDKARGLALDGIQALEDKRTEAARGLLDRAREACPSEPRVLRLAHKLASLDRDRARVEKALGLVTDDRDAAIRELDALGPTPRGLGSMVLDLRRRVERSGDLEGGCLLQVEEAGEFLLMTDDRLRVGNSSGSGFPQIPILAKIRAHHATFERSVSFHAGVTDRVVAEGDAELSVQGVALTSKPLRHGDRVELGGVLPILYLLPSPRSSTALLRVERGFECRGTSRILWVKQGGRDGRVLVGRGREVHVRVPATEPELYLYAPAPGRICLHFAGNGEVDTKRFTGDVDLAAGSVVVCGAISFRVLPL